MRSSLKYILAGVLIIAAVFATVRGSLQPFTKAQLFIKGLKNLSSVKTLDDFTAQFDAVFNYPSPVGNEEVAKFLSDQVTSIVSQQSQPEDVSRVLVSYMESHISQNDLLSLFTIAHFHAILWQRFHRTEDYSQAEQALKRALSIGPEVPPVLYSLASLYASGGDRVKFVQTAQTILSYWPDDTQLKSTLANLASPVPATSATK
ncbi:MAG: tetratricopeptide repeat protein [Minisyncoccia bacterium]|jgi:tetratricopeptide (TPR) repeat protein